MNAKEAKELTSVSRGPAVKAQLDHVFVLIKNTCIQGGSELRYDSLYHENIMALKAQGYSICSSYERYKISW